MIPYKIKSLLFSLMLIGHAFHLFAQQNQKESKLFDHYLDKIENLKFADSPDSAFHYCDLTIQLAKKNHWIDKEIEVILAKAEVAMMKRRFGIMEQNLNLAKETSHQHKTQLKRKVRFFDTEGQKIRFLYQNTIDNNKQAIRMGRELVDSIEDFTNRSDSEKEILVQTLYSLGPLYKKTGDYSNALDCYSKIIILNSDKRIFHIHSYIADCYYAQGNYKLAIKNYFKAIESLLAYKDETGESKPHLLIAAYHGLAKTYLALGKIDLAIESLTKSLKNHNPNDFFLISTYNLFGEINLKGGRHKTAESHFNRALKELKHYIKTGKNHQYADIYLNIGVNHQEQNQLEDALYYYQLAITNLAPNFHETDYRVNPSIEDIDFKMLLLNALTIKAKALFALSKQKQGEKELISLSKRTALLAIQLIDVIRSEYSSDTDKQLLVHQSYSLFEFAIHLALETGTSQEAFYLSEKSRAIVLEEALQNRKAQLLSKVSKDTLYKIQELSVKISDQQKSLPYATNEEAVKNIRSKLLKLKPQHQKLMEAVTQDDRYKKALAQQRFFSIDSIDQLNQRLQDGQVLLEFFVGEQHIYAFMVEAGQSKIRTQIIPHTPALRTAISKINDYIYREADQQYIDAARLIYQELLQPLFSNDSPPKRLIIVPDGQLGYLPFAALLTAPVQTAHLENYPDYPYLIKQTQISLAFSIATLLNQEQENFHPKGGQKILAYAPSFRPIDLSNPQNRPRELLSTLENNEAEVKLLQEKFGAEIVLGEQATYAHFMQQANTASILHLSTHGKVNQEHPELSFIAFSNVRDEDHDNETFKVTVSDIYTQNLPCEMVVLSACETGIGQSVRGEGIISIARAFAYAGTKSIVTSLWSINEKMTANLMERFYAHLDNKTPSNKDAALQQAMLDYLAADIDLRKKSPRHWAAFTIIGDTSSIHLGKNRGMIFWIGLGILSFLLLCFFGVRRNKKQFN